MVDVELLATGKRSPRNFLLELMLEGRVSNALFDVAIPRFRISRDKSLRMLLEFLVGHARSLFRVGENEVHCLLVGDYGAASGPVILEGSEISIPLEKLVVEGF